MMVADFLQYKVFALALWAALFLVLENAFPYAISPFTDKARWQRWGRNAVLVGINFILSPLLIVPLTVLAVTHGLNWRGVFFPEIWFHDWSFILDLLILDFFIYWWHRIVHVVPFFWRFHEVHHLDEFLDVTSATRFHFGEVILSACVRGGVIWLMDIPLLSVIIFETVVLICSIFHHSNIKVSQPLNRILSYFIVTPDWHWMHHHAVRADTDSHYGNLLTIWDRLFKSRAINDRTVEMKMGVGGRRERSLFGLLTRPLDKP